MQKTLPKSFMNSFGFLFSKAAQKISVFYEELLKPLQLKSRHAGILILLHHRSQISQRQIGETLSIDRTSMVKLLDDLENLGYVSREPNPHDRRSYQIRMTEKGALVYPLILQALEKTENQVQIILKQVELADLKKNLLKILLSFPAK